MIDSKTVLHEYLTADRLVQPKPKNLIKRVLVHELSDLRPISVKQNIIITLRGYSTMSLIIITC